MEGGGFTHAGRLGHGVARRVGAVVQSAGDKFNPIALLSFHTEKGCGDCPDSRGSQWRLAEERNG
jgi:hypothetical protein